MKKIIIIAEIGVNHNGDINLAKELIDVASDCGADIVKFQTYDAEELTIDNAPKANYQFDINNINENQKSLLKKFQLTKEDHISLIKYCKKKQIEFLSTPFDIKSLQLLNSLGLRKIKISSGNITDFELLKEIGKLNIEILLSTGMANMQEIKEAILLLEKYGTKRDNICLLHCTSEYPAPKSELNLNAIKTIKDEFGVKVGYSDHTEGIEVAIASVALGAKVIEKHITLDKSMEGPDHRASCTPKEFKTLIKLIRNIENSFGNGIKKPSISETKNIKIVRKSIVASKEIKIGEVFSEDNLTTKRPGFGISPMKLEEIIGKVSNKKYKKDDLISF